MLNNLKLYNPDFVINCNAFENPALVYEIMREQKIKRAYVYGMVYQPSLLAYDFIKIGMSAPQLEEKREHQVGERIVRQIAWVPGWKTEHVKSDHGSAFYFNIQQFCFPKNLLPKTFNKNMLKVAVWDISKRSHQNSMVTEDEDYTSAVWAEGSLAKQYKEKHNGNLPMLNFSDPTMTKIFKGAHIPKSVFNSLFDIS